MEKKLFFIGIIFPLFFFSCYDFTNIETPETVSISSDAKYQLPAGKISFTLKDKIDVKKLREIIDKNAGTSATDEASSAKASAAAKAIEIYDYNPTQKDDALLQFILNYPIKEISPFTSLDSDLGDFTFERKFDVPDFNQIIKDSWNLELDEITLPPITEGLTAAIPAMEKFPWFNITSPGFKTMKLRSGALTVSISKPETPPSEDFSFLVKLTLVDQHNHSNVIAQSPLVNCANGATIKLDLANAYLVPEMEILIEGSLSGGTLGIVHSYKITPEVGGLEIAEITGLNMTLGDEDSHIDISQTFPLSGINSTFKRASIKKGSMAFACILPDNWSGISCKNSEFVMNGGITIPKENFKNTTSGSDFLRQEAALDGLVITPNDVSPEGSFIEFEVKDAHIIFHEEGDALTLSGACKIDEVEEVILDLSAAGIDINHTDVVDTGLNISTLLGDFLDGNDSSNLINNIKFPEIPAYLYITQPSDNEALKALSLEGKVDALYTANGEEKELNLATIDEEGLPVKNTKTTFAGLADENFMVTSDTLFTRENYSCKIEGMSEVFNAHPESLKFRYAVGLLGDNSEIRLTNDDFQILKTLGFRISLALVFPLQIIFDDVTDTNSESQGVRDNVITIPNVLELTGNTFDEDMLKREKSSEGEDWLDYTKIIEYIGLVYELDNETPLENMKITFDLQTNQSSEAEAEPVKIIEPKALETSDGEHVLKFTNEEIESICKTYPVMPLVKVELCDADGTSLRSFNRNAHIDFKASLEIQTSGQMVKIWDKNK